MISRATCSRYSTSRFICAYALRCLYIRKTAFLFFVFFFGACFSWVIIIIIIIIVYKWERNAKRGNKIHDKNEFQKKYCAKKKNLYKRITAFKKIIDKKKGGEGERQTWNRVTPLSIIARSAL